MAIENVQEQEEVVVQEENTTTEEDDNQEETPKTVTLSQKEYKKLNRKAIAYDATKDKVESKPITNTPDISDELKLIARGLTDEEIDQAKIIAKGKDIKLTEAIKDPLFLIYQTNLKEEQRKEDAKLGGARGSSESQDESLVTPDMSREDHQKLFKKFHGIK